MHTHVQAPNNSNTKISRHCRPSHISLNPHASSSSLYSSSDQSPSKHSTTSLVVSTGARVIQVKALQHTSMDSFSVMTPVTPGSSHHNIAHAFSENSASHGDILPMANPQQQQQQQQQQQHHNSQNHENLYQLQTISTTTQFQQQQQQVMYQQQQQQQRLHMQMQLHAQQQQQQQQQQQLQQQHHNQLPPRQRNALQQKILQQQQEQGFPLALSMSFDAMQRQQQQQHQIDTPHSPSLLQHQQQQHSKRGRFGAVSGSAALPTPLSADTNYWPILGPSNLEAIYMDPQSYQNQHNQQLQRLAPPTTVQSITPDHFQKSDFEWITDVSDIASTKTAATTTASGIFNHSGTTHDYGPSPATSSASPSTSTSMSSTPSLSSAASTGGNGSYDLFNTMPPASTSSNGPEALAAVSSALTATTWTEASSPARSVSVFAGPKIPCALEQEAVLEFIAKGSTQSNPMDNRGVRKRRSKGLKEPQTGALSGSPSARESRLQVAPESTSQPATQPSTPLMPTPMSPMKKFADAQFTAQHNNSVHVRQEPCSSSGTSAAPTSGPLSAGSSLFDLLSLSPSTKVEPILSYGEHQRVLSTASQDSRNGNNGHLNSSVSSSPIPKAVAHLRCMSSNSSGSLSNSHSNQIMPSNLSFQVTPKQEGLSHGRRVGNINSSTNASPEVDADADTDADAEGEVYPDLVISGDEHTASSGGRTSGFKRERDLDLEGEADDDDDSDPENGRPATCPHCHKEFQSKGLLRSHVVSHSSDRPFVCWDCADKSYKRNHDLLRHRREKHNIDGNVVPSRGSSRSQQGSASTSRGDMSGSAVERRSSGHHLHQQQNLAHHPPTVASQNSILGNSQHHRHQHQSAHHHHELMYPTHSMMYLSNLSGVSTLESTYSGASSGVEYHQPHHHPLYRTHTQETLTGLGLGVDLSAAFPAPTGLSVVTGGRVSSKGRRSSRGSGGAGPGSAPTSAISLAAAAAATAVAAAGGRKRKLSDASVTTPTTLLGPTAMLSMMSPTMASASSATTSTAAGNAAGASAIANLTHQQQNQHHHLAHHHELASHYQTSGAQYAPISAVAFTEDLTGVIGGAFGGSSA